MNFAVDITPEFRRNIKRLAKKHRSLPDDVNQLVQMLRQSPQLGQSIGHGCYKIRLAVASKGGGKSGGARVITYV